MTKQLDEAAGVYFIVTADERFVKIGYSERILQRLVQIRTIGPGTEDARLIGYVPGTPATEQWLHRKFATDRDSGEWFRYTDRVREFAGSLVPLPDFKKRTSNMGEQMRNVMRELNSRRRSFGGPPLKTFLCRYCGESIEGRRLLRAHEFTCPKRPQSAFGRPPKETQCRRCLTIFPSATIMFAHRCPAVQPKA